MIDFILDTLLLYKVCMIFFMSLKEVSAAFIWSKIQ